MYTTDVLIYATLTIFNMVPYACFCAEMLIEELNRENATNYIE